MTSSSAVPGWSRSKIEWMKALSIGRRFLAWNSGSFLLPLGERRRAFAGPHHGVEREPADQIGMALREQRRAQRARRDAVDQQRPLAAQLLDIARGGEAIVGALRDRRVVVAVLGGAAVALHVDAPAVEAAAREQIHHRGIRPARHLQVEGRLRGHRRAVDEQDRAAPSLAGSPAHFSNRNSFTPPSLVVQCSSPLIASGSIALQVHYSLHVAHACLRTRTLIDQRNVVGLDHLSPFLDLALHERREFRPGSSPSGWRLAPPRRP